MQPGRATVNIVLFDPGEWTRPLDLDDPRAQHLLEILKLAPGDRFAAGELGARVGTLEFLAKDNGFLRLGNPEWDQVPPPLSRVCLIIGTPRPPTARRLLKDLTTLGARELHFAATALGDRSYLQSTLWKGEFHKSLGEGAAQARTTLVPSVTRHHSLGLALAAAPGPGVWFDEGGAPWTEHPVHNSAGGGNPLWLALGPERGWSDAERALFQRHGWQKAGLGPRVLRTETACSLAMGIAVLKGWS